MAESVAALGLAVNILSVLNFGKDFVKLAHGIYNSGQDAFDNFSSLRVISAGLTDIYEDIQRRSLAETTFMQEGDRGIFDLAKQCNEVAQQILNTIKELGLPDPSDNLWSKSTPRRRLMSGSNRHYNRRDAIVAAFKLTWNSGKINALQTRLDRLMTQMTLSLSVSFRLWMTEPKEKQDAILEKLLELQESNEYLKGRVDWIKNREEGLGSALIGFLQNADRSRPDRFASSTELRRGLLNAVYDFSKPPNATETIDFQLPSWRKEDLQKRFISNLSYPDMYEREFRIAEVHKKTFRWIFEDPGSEDGQRRPWANFRQWLESHEQLYWVTGKAGSGKSTLMKFVSQLESTIPSGNKDPIPEKHRRCDPYLRSWAGEEPLVIATFYFWVGGSNIQTSKEGLYRTLLCQILQACPDAIPHIAPRRWEALCLYNEDTKRLVESELEQILNRAIAVVGESRRICLFIDGLDEFSGSYESLIGWVKTALKTPGVKACVASRPWTAFERGLEGKPSLLLEDLTYDDIKDYVTTRFEEDSAFTSLQEREPKFSDDLIERVVRKASGVFLWVDLVCTSLLNGMIASDRVRDLQRRLDELPGDLETLYDRILDNLDKFYLKNAAEYFYLMLACPQPPEALFFYYAAEEDTAFAVNMGTGTLGEKKRGIQIETLRNRLNASCRGLIAIPRLIPTAGQPPVKNVHVQYMHRTVKDYMEQGSVKEKLQGMIEGRFDPHIRLCAAALSIWKIDACHALAFEPDDGELHDEGASILFQCMHHASKVTADNLPEMRRILDELGTSMPHEGFLKQDDFFPAQDTITSKSRITPATCNTAGFGHTLLSLATTCDVFDYVRRKAAPSYLVSPCTEPLGPWRIKSPQQNQAEGAPRMSPLKRFLSRSTTSSSSASDITTSSTHGTEMMWPLLLDALFSRPSPNPQMVEMLLTTGADPNVVINRDKVQTTVWVEALAFSVALSTRESSAASDAWADVLQLLVSHRANIETKTIHQAVCLVDSLYGLSPSQLRVTTSSLQNSFRKHKFRPHLAATRSQVLANAEGIGRMGERAYNPYNVSHLRREAYRARR